MRMRQIQGAKLEESTKLVGEASQSNLYRIRCEGLQQRLELSANAAQVQRQQLLKFH
ncbi:MAG: hypothetical protein MHM6MM_008105, partial [Cercozoa sp. M6MM]